MRQFIIVISIILLNACQQSKVHKAISKEKQLSLQLGNANLWYQQSAEMNASYFQAFDKGKMLLKIKMDTLSKSTVKPAVVLDLDETVLDNSPYEVRLFLNGENYAPESWEKWCNEAKAKALPGATNFLHYADSLGLEIFYISNRKIGVFESTLKNLQSLQLPQAEKDHLLLRTSKSDKTERREMIKEGHQILLYIGDNLTDYDQLFADRDSTLGKQTVKSHQKELLHNFIILPNPMYGEWESAIYGNDYSKTAEEKLELRRKALDPNK